MTISRATTGSASGDEGLPATEQVAVNVVPLFVGSSTGRCFTSRTNPASSMVVEGRTYAGGVIQCGGHAPPEQRASGTYGFSQPPSIPTSARIIGFEGRAVVDETSGARPATLSLQITYDGKPLCSAVATQGDPQRFRCKLDRPRPADFSRLAFRQVVEPDTYYVWAGVIDPHVIVEKQSREPTTPAPEPTAPEPGSEPSSEPSPEPEPAAESGFERRRLCSRRRSEGRHLPLDGRRTVLLGASGWV